MNCIVATLLALAVTAALGPRGFLLTAGASDMYPPLAEVTLRIAQTAARSVVIAVAEKHRVGSVTRGDTCTPPCLPTSFHEG